ncbi:hypothetical protein [Nonlabens agnitus]|uniref:YCII-related domain-containing protein n=1 Tax=Nonlabens agnitus TaxID=870484 RepID=A0A2S9WR72_9FLAO|nr:hypothetical protein [Nonlabens agnitus]PRP65786.1 hypothetical protein BST86_01100 [Nonlabens agnitus]
MRNLKLIWDFKGPDAAQTARHHLIHLKEYIEGNEVDTLATGVEEVTPMHHLCFVAVKEPDMPQVRDDLKPHRGQLWMES